MRQSYWSTPPGSLTNWRTGGFLLSFHPLHDSMVQSPSYVPVGCDDVSAHATTSSRRLRVGSIRRPRDDEARPSGLSEASPVLLSTPNQLLERLEVFMTWHFLQRTYNL